MASFDGGNMLSPPGWINPTTPGSATVLCGNIIQTQVYTTAFTVPLQIGFDAPTSWSDKTAWIPDASGILWTCQTAGIYNFRASQYLSITNYIPPVPMRRLRLGADPVIPVIPNTTFFFDLAASGSPPQDGNLILDPNTGTQTGITATATEPTPDILMGSFLTPVDFLTSTGIAGGAWTLSLFANTTDTGELNTAYFNVYSVDADGVSNPILISNGSSNTFIVNGTDIYNYNVTQTIPTTVVADLTKRIKIELYANIGVISTIVFYFRDITISNITTTISQHANVGGDTGIQGATGVQGATGETGVGTIGATGVQGSTGVAGAGTTIVKDTINLALTITSTETTEFNQVFQQSIPVVLVADETVTYGTSVTGIAIANVGDVMDVSVTSVLGFCTVTSGVGTLPSPASVLSWNLISQGVYGNVGVVV